ncbi:arylamine N-acetyltransferase / N-hydroxyarylamine O-acetyltransferase [Rhipicephalus microplus]|uniref:arylamine N-acetyltransferase / N-hydroxyarylamine O-acetyltransferase n=1 Tax=Rhipicephalus microplus TaxID=6941 RepID=UPI003F6D2795
MQKLAPFLQHLPSSASARPRRSKQVAVAMASASCFSTTPNLVRDCQYGESFQHPDPELFAVAAKQKIDWSANCMGLLSERELRLYLDVLRLELIALREVNLATLNILIKAHVEQIPFQALDAFIGYQSPLDDDSVFDKVIIQRRGGFCFELNSVFGRLLLTLGFKFHMLAARIRWGRPMNTPLTPLGHLLFCIDLGDEGQHFADVGFGGPNPFKAMPVEGEAEPYRVQMLDEERNIEVAIKSTGRKGAPHPRSLFRHFLMVGRFVDGSWLTLVNGRFCRRSISGQVEQRNISDVDEVIHLFDTEFALKLNSDIDLDFLRSKIHSAI